MSYFNFNYNAEKDLEATWKHIEQEIRTTAIQTGNLVDELQLFNLHTTYMQGARDFLTAIKLINRDCADPLDGYIKTRECGIAVENFFASENIERLRAEAQIRDKHALSLLETYIDDDADEPETFPSVAVNRRTLN